MHGYRAYVIGPDGHITDRIDLICESEADAIERAKQLVGEHPIELWDGARKIATYQPKH
jgi:hypothetical protein